MGNNSSVLLCGIAEYAKRQGFCRHHQHEDFQKVTLKQGFGEEPPVPSDPSGDISKVASTKQTVRISEIFSPDRVCARCELHGLVPGSSFDLHTGFDLGRYAVQREVEKAIAEEDPDLLIGSPPCTKFSIFQNLVRAKGFTEQQQGRFEIELGISTFVCECTTSAGLRENITSTSIH